MIPKRINIYCYEDISLIENYEQALNDTTQTWDCHHRLEIELHKSVQELIDLGLYYDRPAKELIFLTHSEHMHLHMTYNNPFKGKIGWNKGKPSPLIGRELPEEHKQHLSEALKGEKHPCYGKKRKEETKNKISEANKIYYKTHDHPIKGKHKVWDNKELNIYHFE